MNLLDEYAAMHDVDEQTFNHAIVVGYGGDQAVSAEAMVESGEFSVHGDYGRVTTRITDMRISTVGEAQGCADTLLRHINR